MHTPASKDYEEPGILYLDILRQAERRGLEIIAFTDHNTANGYRNMQREIADLELLERLGRIRADELGRLNEYRRLLKKILVMPGFEVTATFGFHILGIFSPDMPLRDIDFILLQLRVPSKAVELGLTEAGATSDVLTAYRMIAEAGGIAIAPHANSSSGVFMRGMNIGGQTRIAYTQDSHLSAIELTDLAKGRRSMATWFNGYKPEYSRRMHIIQSSDAHRLTASPHDPKRLGLGDRVTEVNLPELGFDALKELFHSQEFERMRVAEAPLDLPNDQLIEAREKGSNATQSFHSALPKRGDKLTAVLNDVVGIANANGGSIYIGCEGNLKAQSVGVTNTDELSAELSEAIQHRIAPALNVTIDLQHTDDVAVLHIDVPCGDNAPYAVDGKQFYVRDDTDTHVATRDELVSLVRRGLEQGNESNQQVLARTGQESKTSQRAPRHQQAPTPQHQRQQQAAGQGQKPQPQARGPKEQPHQRREQQPRQQSQSQRPASNGNRPTSIGRTERTSSPVEKTALEGAPEIVKPVATPIEPAVEGSPRSGVEILSFEERDGVRYYTVRDLRNKSIVRNVTKKSARDLWLYAIMQHAGEVYDESTFSWDNDRSILSRSQRAGKVRYDIALRDGNGKVHIFYGVADDAMDPRWKELIQATMPPFQEEAVLPQSDTSIMPTLASDTSTAEDAPLATATPTDAEPKTEIDNIADTVPVGE